MPQSLIPCARCTAPNHPSNRSCDVCGLPLGRPAADPEAGHHALGPFEPPDPADPDLGPILRDLALRSGLDVAPAGHGWCLVVPIREARKQAVYLGVGGNDSSGRRLLELVSVCGPANPRDDRRLLELNARVVDGHFAVKVLRGEPYFVVVRNLTAEAAAELDAHELFHGIAGLADRLEERLLKGDDLY